MAPLKDDSDYSGEGEGSVPVWSFIFVNAVLSLITIIGSILVILSYMRDKKIRQTVAYTILLNLSITDLLVGIFIFPINTPWWVTDEWKLGVIPCRMWLVLDYSVFSVSTFTIVFISLDRYWLLTKGLSYQKFQTIRQVVVILAVAWVIIVLLYTFIAFIVPEISTFESMFDPEDCELHVVHSTWFNIFEIVVNFAVPFIALVYLNYKVFTNVRERSKGLITTKYESSGGSGTETDTHESINTVDNSTYANKVYESADDDDGVSINSVNVDTEDTGDNLKPNEETGAGHRAEPPVESKKKKRMSKKKADFKRYRKAAITLGALVVVYCLCCLPYFIYAIVVSFCESCISERVWETVSYLQWANSAMNPFVYGLTNVLYRRNFAQLLCLDRWIKV